MKTSSVLKWWRRAWLSACCAGYCVGHGLLLSPASAVEFHFDYTYDTLGFFQDAERRARLELVGSFFERITDELSQILPRGPLNSTEHTFTHPGSGDLITERDLPIPAQTIVVFVGGRELSGSTIGFGGPAGWSANGSSNFLATVSRRGQLEETLGPTATEFQVAVGAMTFDATAPWNFSAAPPATGQDDFLTVAMHELGHILGYGTADSWKNQVDADQQVFLGPTAQSVHGGPVPLDGHTAHWRTGITSSLGSSTQQAAMDPTIRRGTREFFTTLDIAGLTDIGWNWARDGDTDRDGDVDSADLLSFLEGWTGSLDPFQSDKSFAQGDFDFDGDVDSTDLLGLISSWTGAEGAMGDQQRGLPLLSGTAMAVPEPSVGLLALVGCLCWVRSWAHRWRPTGYRCKSVHQPH